jgi:nicotinate-nucleotide adenylyltransferase
MADFIDIHSRFVFSSDTASHQFSDIAKFDTALHLHFTMKRIGIFGGTFDPIHDGHIHLAKLAKDAADLDEVWFFPCFVSPHKTQTLPSDGMLRSKWLKAALQEIPWARVDTTEIEQTAPSYSYQTLELLSERYPDYEWFWIMGGDQWDALLRWKHPEILARLASFIVLARNGRNVMPRKGYEMQVVYGEHPASSTAIRESLAAGKTEIPYLSPLVASFIQQTRDAKPDEV